jgi:hypothetical protein
VISATAERFFVIDDGPAGHSFRPWHRVPRFKPAYSATTLKIT